MTRNSDSNDKRKGKSPQVQIPSLEKSLVEEQKRQLAEFKPLDTSLPSDANQHDIADSSKKNFDQKIYWFPESYNALRQELVTNWPNLWATVSWNMAYDANEFVQQMNAATGLKLQFDTGKVASICHAFLNELRRLRGLSPLRFDH
jgi:hypothetical protein